MMLKVLISFVLAGSAFGQFDASFAEDRYGIVHLFEWHWDTIADECESFLGPNKIGGVQISPPTENRIVSGRPWWERYQPVSYILDTRSGDRVAFTNMVQRCNAVGVRIYPDVIINHMCGAGGIGTGTAGSYFDADTEDFPAVPYSKLDFNDGNCYTSSKNIEDYGNPSEVRNCRLVSLLDLNQGKSWVRDKIINFMNDLIEIGVAGFRVDACKHMWPGDLKVIFGKLHDLKSDTFGTGKKPYIFQEVIDQGNEPIKATDYIEIGAVTEFKYGKYLAENKFSLQYIGTIGESWGLLQDDKSLVFINNHDNQRGHGGGGTIIYYENPYDLKIFTAFMLAHPYGTPRVMSSYEFSNSDEGPPSSQRNVNADETCGNGWVCEHRWRPIKNMFAFAVAVQGTEMQNWWSQNNRIAFSRGDKGFIAINKSGYMNENLQTGLPDGSYCDVINGDYNNGVCTGPCVNVSDGVANIQISDSSGEQIVAIHVDAMTNTCNA